MTKIDLSGGMVNKQHTASILILVWFLDVSFQQLTRHGGDVLVYRYHIACLVANHRASTTSPKLELVTLPSLQGFDGSAYSFDMLHIKEQDRKIHF